MVKKNKTSIIDKVLENFHLVVVNEKTLKKRDKKVYQNLQTQLTNM